MKRETRTAITIDAWSADVQNVISQLDRLRASVVESEDIAAMDMKPARRELESIVDAVEKIRSGLSALKRDATRSSTTRKLPPGRPNPKLSDDFGRRVRDVMNDNE